MLLNQRRTRGREATGPTPHSVAVVRHRASAQAADSSPRAKFPPSRPMDHLILERQKQDAAGDKVLEFTRYQQTCDVKNSWLKSSDRHFLRGAIKRRVRAADTEHKSNVDQRRQRLKELLEEEEQQLLKELEEQEETMEERQNRMRERARLLRERRERERQQLVSDKMEQLFIEQCEELRTVQSRRQEQQVCVERAAQVRSRQEQRQQQQEEDRLFDELWEADRQAKDDRERRRAQRQRQNNQQQLDVLKTQMEAAEQQRQREKELREEEAHLMRQQQETQLLQEQQEQQQKLQAQQTRRRQLDQGRRMKIRRQAREQQDELRLDMSILQQLLQQETDERQEAAQRKVELREEQHRYRQFLLEELQRQRREEQETEQLMEDKMRETWTRREEQILLQREARNRLMDQVLEARRLQIQQNLELNLQNQTEVSREREELNRVVEEMKVKDEEERRRWRRSCEGHQQDLRAQMEHQQQLRLEERAQAQREHQQGLILQQLYNHNKDQILSRPSSHTTPHPFRREEGSGAEPRPGPSIT